MTCIPIIGSVASGIGNIYMSAMLEQVVEFPTYSAGGATLFVIVYSGSKLCTGALPMMTCEALPLVDVQYN